LVLISGHDRAPNLAGRFALGPAAQPSFRLALTRVGSAVVLALLAAPLTMALWGRRVNASF
jgi:hypothetical protein